MAKSKSTRRPQVPANPPPTDDSADPANSATAARLRAFLASMVSLPDCAYEGRGETTIADGRVLIERLAESATDDNPPTLTLSLAQCIDVLGYLGQSRPANSHGGDWWLDPEQGASHVVGYYHVIDALRDSIAKANQAREIPERPVLEARLSGQEDQLARARGICSLVSIALNQAEDSIAGYTQKDLTMLRLSIEALRDLLEGINYKLEPDVMLGSDTAYEAAR